MIRDANTDDAPAIAAIYNHYVKRSVATFEERPVPDDVMAVRIAETAEVFPWLVHDHGGVAGFAYAASWKTRSAYRNTVETTVYLDPAAIGRGIGTELYEALLAELRRRGLRTAVASIALPNDASIALHEKLGYRHIGTFHDIGWKFDRWVDVGHWQLML